MLDDENKISLDAHPYGNSIRSGPRRPFIVNLSPSGRPYDLKSYRRVRSRGLRSGDKESVHNNAGEPILRMVASLRLRRPFIVNLSPSGRSCGLKIYRRVCSTGPRSDDVLGRLIPYPVCISDGSFIDTYWFSFWYRKENLHIRWWFQGDIKCKDKHYP